MELLKQSSAFFFPKKD